MAVVDAVCAAWQVNVTCNVLLLPSVLALALFLLRAVYPLYIPALRNLSEFERVKTDHLIVVHIGKNNRLYALLRVIWVFPYRVIRSSAKKSLGAKLWRMAVSRLFLVCVLHSL